eukprot:m.150910 g.150910  ORF g.150910 m.150910 type:complete len:1501 (+) comp38558_c0_seq16:74-4576(+)
MCSFLFTFFLALFVAQSHSQKSDALRNILTSFANDGLGVATLQSKYDSLTYSSNIVESQSAVDELSGVLNGKFEKRKQIAIELKEEAERFLNGGTNDPPWSCCSLLPSSLKYDSRFSNNIDLTRHCNRLSGDSSSGALFNVGDRLLSNFEANLRSNPTLKWQYFASEDGLISIYPAFKVDDCDNYDPRFRSWYVSAAVPEPRDIVLVIDKSGSMDASVGSSTRMDLAKEAAKTVLETLNPHDRVAAISFSTGIQSVDEDSCYSNGLARATNQTIFTLTKFVDELNPAGTTNYKSAFATAFDLLINSPPPSNSNIARDKVILFLTDGAPSLNLGSNRDIMQTIYDKNQVFGFEVVILTYGMGSNIGTSGETLLQDIADQNYAKYLPNVNNDAKPGKADIVRNDNRIRQQLGSYYAFFEPVNIEEVDPIMTVPYYDLFGLGLVLTMAVPVYVSKSSQRTLAGVIGIDITLADLVSEVTFYGRGELSYAFIVDNMGVTLTHPLLPVPTNVNRTPTYVDISTLESQTTNFQDVRRSMLSGGNGSVLLNTKWTVPLGDSKMEGVRLDSVRARYTWLHISGTSYSVCLVVAESFTMEYFPTFQQASGNYLYHRFDLVPPTQPKCSQFGRLAVASDASFKIAPKGFKDPFAYLDLVQTASVAQKYIDYLSGRASSNVYFQRTVKGSLASIYKIVSTWTQSGNDYSNFIVWRYVGTQDGAFIVLPGIQQAKEFDHTERPWYKRTMASPGNIVLSAPYLDGFGAGYVITLSHTIVAGRGSNPEALAVAAMDFTLPYFWTQLVNAYPECRSTESKRCIVIDSSGFVVMHPDFVDPSVAAVEGVQDKHITQLEEGIASSLISSRLMVEGRCNDLERKKVNIFWKVDISGGSQNVFESQIAYDIYKVDGTNSFLIISTRWDDSSSCACDTSKPLGSRACPTSSATCRCPCSTDLSFNVCEGVDSVNAQNIPVCPPESPPLAIAPQAADATASLSSCLNNDCAGKKEKSDCFGVVGCDWCSYDYATGSPLGTPYCEESRRCPLGSKGSPINLDGGGGGGGGAVLRSSTTAAGLDEKKRPLPAPRKSMGAELDGKGGGDSNPLAAALAARAAKIAKEETMTASSEKVEAAKGGAPQLQKRTPVKEEKTPKASPPRPKRGPIKFPEKGGEKDQKVSPPRPKRGPMKLPERKPAAVSAPVAVSGGKPSPRVPRRVTAAAASIADKLSSVLEKNSSSQQLPRSKTTAASSSSKNDATVAEVVSIGDYDGAEGEVAFKVGEKGQLVEKNENGWWYVRFGSMEGWAPSTYLEEKKASSKAPPLRPSGSPAMKRKEEEKKTSSKAPPLRPSGSPATKRKKEKSAASSPLSKTEGKPKPSRSNPNGGGGDFVTTGSYSAAAEGEIGFSAGESANVLEKTDSGWWFIKIGTKEGWAPSTYLELSKVENGGKVGRPTPHRPARVQGNKGGGGYRALAAFKGDDGFGLEEGETLVVEEKADSGWWYVKTGGREGWAPSTYIEST